MARLDRIAPRLPWVAAAVVVALMAASVPLKTASADRDDWRHRYWHGDRDYGGSGGFYFYSGPSYYYAPPAYYYPPPAYYYPPPAYYGPSFGLSVRVR